MRAKVFILVLCFFFISLPSKAAAIHDAAKKRDVAAIMAALDGGADINEIDSDGEAPALYYSALGEHLDAARLLIAHGADVNLASKWGGAPIFRVASQGHDDILSLLVANGANPNSQFRSNTALHKAAER